MRGNENWIVNLCLMKITIIILLISTLNTVAQDALHVDSIRFKTPDLNNLLLETTTSITFILPQCPYNKTNALFDIENDTMSLLIHGGLMGFDDINNELSSQFQTNYKVTFVFLGCIRNWDIETEDTHGYNEIIFTHLQTKYGNAVKKEFDEIWN